MQLRLVTKSLTFLLIVLLLAVCSESPVLARKNGATPVKSQQDPSEVSFVLSRLPEDPRRYSLLISDADEHNMSGTFSVDQLQILRAIMVEAEKFALTADSAGVKEPITTRFLDKNEPAFVCDVQKTGMESAFFLTLTSEIGRMTLSAGKIIRSTRREQGIFFDLLSRLEAILPKLPAQPAK
jgi:hypothetical protein